MNKLIFGDIEVTKKEGIKLKDVIVDNITVSGKVKGNNENALHSKYYIEYIVDNNVIRLILLLPVMS